jgi:hypothetical protein
VEIEEISGNGHYKFERFAIYNYRYIAPPSQTSWQQTSWQKPQNNTVSPTLLMYKRPEKKFQIIGVRTFEKVV